MQKTLIMIVKNNNYTSEEYRGYLIFSHKNNVLNKSIDNTIMVSPVDDIDSVFIIGLDDSKSTGQREFIPINRDDAIAYIDWLMDH